MACVWANDKAMISTEAIWWAFEHLRRPDQPLCNKCRAAADPTAAKRLSTCLFNGHVIFDAALLLYWLAVRPWSAQEKRKDKDE